MGFQGAATLTEHLSASSFLAVKVPSGEAGFRGAAALIEYLCFIISCSLCQNTENGDPVPAETFKKQVVFG